MMKFILIISVISIILAGCASVPIETMSIRTPDAPVTPGNSSQGILSGNTLYLSGQIGADARTGQVVPGGIISETRQILENIDAILQAVRLDARHIVKLEIFLTSLDDFNTVQSMLDSYFQVAQPAIQVVAVTRLHGGAQISIVATAVRQ
jgi:2-iminobutanoate/2-iminopropanoate deaminase